MPDGPLSYSEGDERGSRIATKGLFQLMWLPTELRLKILELLLIMPEDVEICYPMPYSKTTKTGTPHASILRTCKRINGEGTPILYGQNNLRLCLATDKTASAFFSTLRWTTIGSIDTITFTSSIPCFPGQERSERATPPYKQPYFACSGADVLGRFYPADFRYSPIGPDRYMALSISNWVSMKVMQAEMKAIQLDFESYMGPDAPLLV